MKSANEEYQSVNEELQSSNEELETSKEEMQSINEELHTVNTELQGKNAELVTLNSDLRNLLESTQVAVLFLDAELRIRSYTPAMTDLFHLRNGDRGRPITEISSRISYPEIQDDVARVLRTLNVAERTLRGDGTTFLLRMRPYRTVENVINGVVLTFFDISERERHQADRRWLASIVDSLRDAVIGYDAGHRITSWNPAAERMLGYAAAQAVGQPLDWLLESARAGDLDTLTGARTRPAGQVEVEMDWRLQDGDSLPVLVTGSPVRDGHGHVAGGSLVVRDNSERLRAARHSEMMLGELNHRVKNTLATVQAMVQQTLRGADNMQAFSEVFLSRLLALSNTHNLLAHEAWRGVILRDLVLAELRPFAGKDSARVEVGGDEVRLVPKLALALSMALHELTTNAVKYGALSVPRGSVSVHWKIRRREGQPWLHLDWAERDGPAVHEPKRTGFGFRLITDGLALELDGEVKLQFARGGVVCRIRIPVPDPDSGSSE